MKYNHKTGARSHVRVMQDHQTQDDDFDEECTEIDLFRVTHTDEDGSWINSAAEDDYKAMCELLAAAPEVVDGVVQPRLTNAEIVEQVCGNRSGYIKGLGAGPAHSRVSSISSSARSRVREDSRVDELETQNVALMTELNDLKGKYDDLLRDFGEFRNMFISFTQSQTQPPPPS